MLVALEAMLASFLLRENPRRFYERRVEYDL